MVPPQPRRTPVSQHSPTAGVAITKPLAEAERPVHPVAEVGVEAPEAVTRTAPNVRHRKAVSALTVALTEGCIGSAATIAAQQ